MNDEDRALRDWARGQIDDAPAVSVPDLPADRKQPKRVWLPVMAAAVVIGAVAAGVVVFRDGSPSAVPPAHSSGHSRSPSAVALPPYNGDHTVPSGRAAAAVVHDGDTVTLTATVVGDGRGEVRACYPMYITGVGGSEHATDKNPFAECAIFVRLTGADLHKLADSRTVNGATSGYAALVGIYHHGTVAVTRQSRPVNAPSDDGDTVPCAPPPGGWPHNEQSVTRLQAASAYKRKHPGSIVEIAYLNPSSTQHLVYVLTTGDPAPVRAALDVGKNDLCVVRSRYTPQQLQHARTVMRESMGRGDGLTSLMEAGGYGLSADKQPAAPIGVPMLSMRIAHLVDAQPNGLVQADVWLVPVRK